MARSSKRIMRTAAVAVALAAAPASAQQAVDLSLKTVVSAGQHPSIQVNVLSDVKSVELSLTGSGGASVHRRWGALRAGASETVGWPQAPGKVQQFRGTLRVRSAEGDAEESPLEFESVILSPLEIQIDRGKVDLERRRLEIVLSRPAGKCDIVIKGEHGETLHDDTVGFHEEPSGTPVEVTWPKLSANPARIDLRAYDKFDSYAGVALIPWNVLIPHEEVNFELDSDVIRPSEYPKLDASQASIVDQINKYQAIAKELGTIKLFIAGHTDTLASNSYNKDLSTRRARSIARHFKQKGLPIPILSYGFGEERPLVLTGDSVAEPRNRRVDYMIAVDPPLGVGWEKIK